MKVTVAMFFSFLILAIPCSAQIEQGDSEVRFIFFYSRISGSEFSSGGSGSLMLSYGRFFTPRLQVGVGPRLNFSSDDDGTETSLSGSVFASYNLTEASKTVPYLNAEWYQMDFSPEVGDFTDWSYITFGFGVRNFFTEYAALNSAISYGFSLSSETEGGLLMIMSGLSFFF